MDDEQLDISRNPGKKRLRSRSRSLFANDDVGGLDERDGTIPADCMEFVATAPMSIDAGKDFEKCPFFLFRMFSDSPQWLIS